MQIADHKKHFDSNRELWNRKTMVHKGSDFYDLESFMNGKNCLNEIEIREVGPVEGKTMLHLQCHFGMDSLSFSRLGAKVTGVDFSDAAIEEARRINHELGLDASFICSNIYDLPEHLDQQFDIVFTSYGVIGWLPDLQPWAALVNRYLKPGGFFYMAEFHPVVWMLDEDFTGVKYYYHNRELIEVDVQGTYADRYADIRAKEYSWNHSISEVLNPLAGEGLVLELFNEYPYSPYSCFNKMVKGKDGNYRVEGLEDKIPMVYSVRFRKPAH